jgi:carboxypeptidase C (cathepsin A)
MDAEEPHGYMFYVAYRMKPTTGVARPLTFLWGGGPSGPALREQFLFGPKSVDKGKIVDNDLTLLAVSDLVFVDPIGTGFSRPAKSEYGKEFYGVLGDQASVAEFVRVWRAKYDPAGSPLFLYGVSYGTWRASGVTELLEKNGIRVAGTILQSGGVQLGADAQPAELRIAYRTPGRAATAFHHGKLSPDVGKTLDEVLKSSEKWAVDVYAPALARIASLSDAERDDIARQLSKYTGYPVDKIDRKTLSFTPAAFLNNGLIAGSNLNNYDGREINAPAGGRGSGRGGAAAAGENPEIHYIRNDLEYHTDLAYLGTERGYMPTPGPAYTGAGPWQYNSGKITPEIMAAAQAGEGPPGTDAWIKRAMEIDPKLKVLVAVGLYDSLNSCAGNIDVVNRFPEIAANFTNTCYLGGHQFQRMPGTQQQFAADFRDFIARTTALGR